MSRPVPICYHCQKAMKCEKNDFPVRDVRTKVFPATIWLGDRFLCHGCGGSIIVGFGAGRVEDECPKELVEKALEFSR